MKRFLVGAVAAFAAMAFMVACASDADDEGHLGNTGRETHRDVQGVWSNNTMDRDRVWFNLTQQNSVTVTEGIRGTVNLWTDYTYHNELGWKIADEELENRTSFRTWYDERIRGAGTNQTTWAFLNLNEFFDQINWEHADDVETSIEIWNDFLAYLTKDTQMAAADIEAVYDSTIVYRDLNNIRVGEIRTFYFKSNKGYREDVLIVYYMNAHDPTQFTSYNIPPVGRYFRQPHMIDPTLNVTFLARPVVEEIAAGGNGRILGLQLFFDTPIVQLRPHNVSVSYDTLARNLVENNIVLADTWTTSGTFNGGQVYEIRFRNPIALTDIPGLNLTVRVEMTAQSNPTRTRIFLDNARRVDVRLEPAVDDNGEEIENVAANPLIADIIYAQTGVTTVPTYPAWDLTDYVWMAVNTTTGRVTKLTVGERVQYITAVPDDYHLGSLPQGRYILVFTTQVNAPSTQPILSGISGAFFIGTPDIIDPPITGDLVATVTNGTPIGDVLDYGTRAMTIRLPFLSPDFLNIAAGDFTITLNDGTVILGSTGSLGTLVTAGTGDNMTVSFPLTGLGTADGFESSGEGTVRVNTPAGLAVGTFTITADGLRARTVTRVQTGTAPTIISTVTVVLNRLPTAEDGQLPISLIGMPAADSDPEAVGVVIAPTSGSTTAGAMAAPWNVVVGIDTYTFVLNHVPTANATFNPISHGYMTAIVGEPPAGPGPVAPLPLAIKSTVATRVENGGVFDALSVVITLNRAPTNELDGFTTIVDAGGAASGIWTVPNGDATTALTLTATTPSLHRLAIDPLTLMANALAANPADADNTITLSLTSTSATEYVAVFTSVKAGGANVAWRQPATGNTINVFNLIIPGVTPPGDNGGLVQTRP